MLNEVMVCFCCRNYNCESYTIYRGYLMCEFCLDDWLKEKIELMVIDFEYWATIQKQKLEKELENAQK